MRFKRVREAQRPILEWWRTSSSASSSTSCDQLRVRRRLASLIPLRRARPARSRRCTTVGVARGHADILERGPLTQASLRACERALSLGAHRVLTRAPTTAAWPSMRCACRLPLSPATPPPIPTHASIASSSHGRGRARLRAGTCWLYRAYPKGHPCATWRPGIFALAVCALALARWVPCSLTSSPQARGSSCVSLAALGLTRLVII